MLYLVGQIILCLMFTALIGVAVGWLLRGLGAGQQTESVEARWRPRVVELERELAAATAAAAAAESEAPASPGPDATSAAELQTLRERLAQRERELASLRTAQAVRQPSRPVEEDLVERVREAQQLCQQLQGHLGEQRAANDQLVKQLELAQTERDTLIMRVRDTEGDIGRLTKERQHALTTIANLQNELRAVRTALARVAKAPPTAASARVGEPRSPAPRTAPMQRAPSPGAEASGGQASETSDRADEPGRDQITTLHAQRPGAAAGPQNDGDSNARQRQLPGVSRPTGDTAPQLTPGYEPPWRLQAPQGERDNLQAIYGIGPKLESRLNELGVFHFSQIASFGRDDILWVAERLAAFPGRILRDRWVDQARRLATDDDAAPGGAS